MMKKKWFMSKVLWFNIATFVLICADELAKTKIDPQLILLMGIFGNIILRFLTTKGLE